MASDLEYAGSIRTKVIEECAKLTHILCKIERFGWCNYHPDDPPEKTNRVHLLEEIEDVITACKELREYTQSIHCINECKKRK